MTDPSRGSDHSHSSCESGCGFLMNLTGKAHTAVLQQAGKYDLLRRKDDLFDEGVSAIFRIYLGEAELQAICFDASRFTAGQAREWLLAWGIKPRLFQTAIGR